MSLDSEKIAEALAPELKAFEKVRKKESFKRTASIILVVSGAIGIIVLSYLYKEEKNPTTLLFFYFVIVQMIRSGNGKPYIKNSAQKKLKKVITKHLYPQYTFLKKTFVSQKNYIKATASYSDTDKKIKIVEKDKVLISGKLNNRWNFSCSEIINDNGEDEDPTIDLFYAIKMPYNLKRRFYYNPLCNEEFDEDKSLRKLMDFFHHDLQEIDLKNGENTYNIFTESEELLQRVITADFLKYLDSLQAKFEALLLVGFSLIDDHFFLLISAPEKEINEEITSTLNDEMLEKVIEEVQLLLDPIHTLIPLLQTAINDIKQRPLEDKEEIKRHDDDDNEDLIRHLILD